ncbi:MAG: hypothetical protein HKN18_18390 [Silicimonas sp.]|nr:hypothetical protein [Silicimonas sp.]
MSGQTQRILSELPSGDPALLNRIAWARRWSERRTSTEYALAAREKALDGTGRRSEAEQGLALRTLGWQAMWRGDLKLSMDYCLRAESHLSESEYPEARACLYANLATLHYFRNRLDLATCAIDRGIWLMGEDEASPALAELVMTQAVVQRLAGERARAGISLGRARELAQDEIVPTIDAYTACWLVEDGDSGKAETHAKAALSASQTMVNRVVMPYARATLAVCHAMSGDFVEAVDQINTGLKHAKEDDDLRARCIVLIKSARIARLQKDEDKEFKVLREAAEIAREQDFAMWRKQIALMRAELFEARGNYKAAVEQHKLAWALQKETRVR